MNPFKYGQVVSGNDFCDRPELIRHLSGFIESRQNVYLTGERRVGKTSLIHQTLEKLDKFSMLYIDLLEVKSISDVCRRMISGIMLLEHKEGFFKRILSSLSHLRPTLSLDPVTGQPSLSVSASASLEPDSISGILAVIGELAEDRRTVVVFDEFQDILNLKNSGEALALLRSGIQFQSKTCYIFAGSIRSGMDLIFTDSESPFFKSAVAMEVGPIEEENFRGFLLDKFSTGKRKASPEVIKSILDLAQHNPGDAQELCGCIWDCTARGDRITTDHFQPALQLIFTREGKAYETSLIMISAQQLRCLTALARTGGESPLSGRFLEESGIRTPSSVQKALARLIKLKLIYRSGKQYRFVNPFFAAWLLWKKY